MKLHILIAILLIIVSAEAATLRVCPSGCDYSSIQTAIKYADPGDTINVSEGIYKENIMTTKPLAIEGSGIGRTLIDGSFSGPVFTIGPGLSTFGPDPNVSLSGITIERGKADFGAGIFNKGGSVTLINCSITHNEVYGGAVYNTFNGTMALNGCTISGNRAATGGGIYSNGAAINMHIGSISNNTANRGGGIFNDNGPMNLIGGSIGHNYAVTYGGGIYSNKGLVNLSGSSIDHNYARMFGGGGIYNNLGWLNLKGSSIDHNYAGTYGGGIYDNVDTSSGLYSTVNLYNGSIDHNTAKAKLSGGGIYSVYGTVIMGNRSLVHENDPDQIRTVGS